jgi:threonine aldolase
LVCIENTANRAGGTCYSLEHIIPIRRLCDEHGLKLHLDGARLFNALIATNETALEYGKQFHSISICLNKGLGCPIGSILIGEKDFIRRARRVRKLFGGGMRQAGYMAAAGIYALDNHITRLAEDHAHTKQIADAVSGKSFTGEVLPVETNILIFEVKGRTAQQLAEELKQHNILVIAISPTQVRMVLHLDVTPEMVKEVIRVIQSLA